MPAYQIVEAVFENVFSENSGFKGILFFKDTLKYLFKKII